ncbi:hypothetical protein Hanom_Chr10g00914611 [Helianthus anomalus]
MLLSYPTRLHLEVSRSSSSSHPTTSVLKFPSTLVDHPFFSFLPPWHFDWLSLPRSAHM